MKFSIILLCVPLCSAMTQDVSAYLDTLVAKHGESLLEEMAQFRDPDNEDARSYRALQQQLEQDRQKTWYIGDTVFNKLDDTLLANMVARISARFPSVSSVLQKLNPREMGLFYYAYPNSNIFEDLE